MSGVATPRTVLAWLRPYPHVLPTIAALGIVASLAEGLGIALLMPFLASIGTDAGGAAVVGTAADGVVVRAVSDYAASFPPGTRRFALAATVCLAAVLSATLSVAYVRVLSKAATRVSHDLRLRLFERFLTDGSSGIDKGSQGRRVKAVDGAAHRAGQAVISLSLLVVNAGTISIVLVLLMLISWRMSLVVLAGVAVAGLAVRTLVARGTAVGRSHERAASRLSDTAIHVLGSLRMIRLFGQERRELEGFARESDAVRRDQLALETMRRATDPLVDGIAVPLLVAGLLAASVADVAIAVLLPFLLLVFRLQRHVREFDASRVWLAADAGAVDEVETLLGAPIPVPSVAPVPFERLSRSIRFDDVSFVRPDESSEAGESTWPDGVAVLAPPPPPSLRDVTFEIRRGETLGIVGGSGAGKSTLIDLLCGLSPPSAGTISVDGVTLERLDLAAWRRRIGFAGQDAELRAGTVFENIAYGCPGASETDVREAAGRAGAADFVERWPDGYATPVGARGQRLSGGERQRIALARALIRHPDVLILDEATNALDNVTEALIRETLERLSGSLTMIVVAHRLASIRHVDRVLVLEGGRLVEEGAPAALAGGDGVFGELARLEVEPCRPGRAVSTPR